MKDDHAWCTHAGKGGCKIYGERPQACREFNCQWLMNEKLGPHWFPKDAKIVVDMKVGEKGAVLAFVIDPKYPNRWREDPWRKDIMTLATRGMMTGMWSTIVLIREEMIVIGP